MRPTAQRRHQRGAYIITFALFLLVLLGFMGFAIDFGRLFVVKTELQTALDSCALAAARELDLQPNAIERAQNAGASAGIQNGVNLQSATWSTQDQLKSNISFRDSAYAGTADGTKAVYAQCQYTMSGIRLWLMQAMGAFTGDRTTYPGTGSVGTMAVATRGSAQSPCPIPAKIRLGSDTSAPDGQGYQRGQWIKILDKDASASDYGWAILDPSLSGASVLENQIVGALCTTPSVGDALTTTGVKAASIEAWNARFGVYKDSTPNNDLGRPARTGYAYTDAATQGGQWSSTAGHAYDDPVNGFVVKSQSFATCSLSQPNASPTVKNCEDLTGISLNGGIKSIAPTSYLQTNGVNDRRLVLAPVVDASSNLQSYACVLMLHPMSPTDKNTVWVEYVANASKPDSPCTTSGLAGGSNNLARVPVLVR